MRKFVKRAVFVGLAATTVLVVLSTGVSLLAWHKTVQVQRFYRENRLLGEMHARQTESTNDSASARELLLNMLPLGADREAAVNVLRREGFSCQIIPAPVAATRLRQHFLEARGLTKTPNNGAAGKDFIDCQTASPHALGHVRWIVDLEFDADGHLSDAGVAIWYIFI